MKRFGRVTVFAFAALAIGLLGTSGVARAQLVPVPTDDCLALQALLGSGDPLAGVKARLSGQDLSDNGGDNLPCDLSDANLSRAFLRGTDLTKAILVGTAFREAKMRGAELVGADLSCGLVACMTEVLPDDGALVSDGADLREADLGGADLFMADLRGANLASAKLRGADLTDVIWGDTICPDETISNFNPGGTCENNLKSPKG